MDRSINPTAISYDPKINSRKVQGKRNGGRAWVATGEEKGKDNEVKEVATGQTTVPDESNMDVSFHVFCKWGTTALFDMRIFNLDASSYLRQTSTNGLASAEKDKRTSKSSSVWSVGVISLLWCTARMELP